MFAIQFIPTYLQMRIDFSQMEQEQFQNHSTTSIFSVSLPEMWKDNSKKQMQNEQDLSQLSFQVKYPYEVSRSVSPSAIKNEVSYLRANKILPASTLRFIEQSLSSQIESNKRQGQSESSIPYQQQRQSQVIAEKVNTAQNPAISNSTIKKRVNKKYQHIKPKVYDIKENSISKKCYQKQFDLQNVTLRPILNYTLNSKAAKKINDNRSHLYKTSKSNVFEQLYQNAGIYEIKKSNKRKQNERQSKSNKKSSRINISSTFEERLQTSIQKQGQRKKKAQNNLEFDLSTGQSLFTPDTSRSKITYLTHFKSFRDIAQTQQEINCNHSCRFNHSQQIIKTQDDSLSRQLNKSLESKYPIVRKTLPKQNKIAQVYAELLWNQDHIAHQQLEAQQKRVLSCFLKHIDTINSNSQSVTKQFFIAYFRQFYTNLNLFDKAILQNRLKPKQQKKEKEVCKQPKGLKSKVTFPSRLDHTYKHFYV